MSMDMHRGLEVTRGKVGKEEVEGGKRSIKMTRKKKVPKAPEAWSLRENKGAE